MFASMGAMLVAALALPAAFGDDALLFAVAYLVVRVLHIVLFAQGPDDLEVREAARALAPSALLAPTLLIVAAFFDGVAQGAIWAVVLALDYGSAGCRSWRRSRRRVVRPAPTSGARPLSRGRSRAPATTCTNMP